MRKLRSKLSYANVVATLALFVALGGSAAAISVIDGHLIKNHSITGKKVKSHTVGKRQINTKGLTVPKAEVADRAAVAVLAETARKVDKLSVTSSGRASASRARASSSRKAKISSVETESSLIKLSVGEKMPLFNNETPPFVVMASCNDLGEGSYQLEVTATASESWVGGEVVSEVHAPEEVGKLYAVTSTAPFLVTKNGQALTAPATGASYSLSEPLAGVKSLGADCVISQYAIG